MICHQLSKFIDEHRFNYYRKPSWCLPQHMPQDVTFPTTHYQAVYSRLCTCVLGMLATLFVLAWLYRTHAVRILWPICNLTATTIIILTSRKGTLPVHLLQNLCLFHPGVTTLEYSFSMLVHISRDKLLCKFIWIPDWPDVQGFRGYQPHASCCDSFCSYATWLAHCKICRQYFTTACSLACQDAPKTITVVGSQTRVRTSPFPWCGGQNEQNLTLDPKDLLKNRCPMQDCPGCP